MKKNNNVKLCYLILLSFIFSFLSLSCTKPSKDSSIQFEKDSSAFYIKSGRTKRKALITLPYKLKFNVAEQNQKFSLVFVLHGANSNASEIKEQTGFDSYANDFDFIFVYPEGGGNRWEKVSDNIFFNDMINHLSTKYNIGNIYFTGFSAGAIKVFELAQVFADKTTAIAPVSGLLKKTENPENLYVTDILHIHSKDDTEVPFAGSEEEGYYSVEEEINIFRKKLEIKNENKDVELFTYETQGHVWNKKNTDLILDFFYNHPKKKTKVKVELNSSSIIQNVGNKINATVSIENISEVKSVKVHSNNTLVYSSDIIKNEDTFDFKNDAQGLFYLKAELELNDGQIIYSTLNPYYINIRNSTDSTAPLNLVEIKSAESSSIETTLLEAKNCIDKNLNTRWSSNWNDNQTLILDLGKACDVSKMILFWEMACAKNYNILCSANGKDWQNVFEQPNCSGGIEIIDFEKTQANYIKIDLLERDTRYGFSLWEVFILN